MSLWKDGGQKETWEEMLRYRDGRGRNFGNTFFQFMAEKSGDLSGVDKLFSSLTNANLLGSLIPVSLEPAQLCFSTKSGKVYKGEHHLDDLRMSFDKVGLVWLEPKVQANPEAEKSLSQADIIIVCPGSMFGSILINFLPEGISRAYKKSKARKILMTNIMSVACENNGFDQDDYVRVFRKYVRPGENFDLIIMPDFSALEKTILTKALKMYQYEHSFPIRAKHNSKHKTVIKDIITIEEKNLRLRHCEKKLANLFISYILK